MKKNILITGPSGYIGVKTLDALINNPEYELRLFLSDEPSEHTFENKVVELYGKKLEYVYGDITKFSDCIKAIENIDYVIHLAEIIPPESIHNPSLAERINYFGVKNIVDAIKKSGRDIKLINIGSMCQYGNRNYLHPWTRVGDPLLPSFFDCYAVTKIRAERYVVESGLRYWVQLRIAPIIHGKLLKDNINDAYLLHVPLNAPIETVATIEIAALFKNIINFDCINNLPSDFWRRIYNVGGGENSRITGYEFYEKCFNIAGIQAEKMLEPQWIPLRNYTTSWYSDGDELENLFRFRSEGINDFFSNLFNSYYNLKYIKPLSKVLKKLFIERLINCTDSPYYWIDNGMTPRVNAYFGSYEKWRQLPKRWSNYPILAKNKVFDKNENLLDVDYAQLKNQANSELYKLDHGFDDKKSDVFINFSDLAEVAAFRGGKCLSPSFKTGDMHTPLLWQCSNGHIFKATAYGVLRAGYWCGECCTPSPWDIDSVAEKVPFFAQVWYDSRNSDEATKITAKDYYDIKNEDEKDKTIKKDKIIKYKKG